MIDSHSPTNRRRFLTQLSAMVGVQALPACGGGDSAAALVDSGAQQGSPTPTAAPPAISPASQGPAQTPAAPTPAPTAPTPAPAAPAPAPAAPAPAPASPAPSPSSGNPTVARLTGLGAACTNVPASFLVVLDAPADKAYTITPICAGATVSPSSLTIPAGQLAGTFTVAAGGAGDYSVDFSVAPTLARAARPATLSVFGPTSALAQLAASMSAGQWRQLNVSGMSQSQFLAGSNWVTAYLDKGCHDPINRQVRFFGQAHLGDQRWFQYDDASNTFSVLADPPWDDGGSSGSIPSWQYGHGYQGNTVDPASGDQYFRRYSASFAYSLNRQTNNWSQTANASGWDGINGTAGGIEWLPSIGTAGGLVLWCRAQLYTWNKATNAWTRRTSPFPSDFGVHNIAQRNFAADFVYIGGGDGRSSLAKVSGIGVATALAPCPVQYGINTAVTTTCPRTGELIVIKGNSSAYKYIPTTNSWAGVSMAGAPAIFGESVGAAAGVIAVPMPAYGVIAFFATIGTQQAWIYRHA